MLKSSQKPALCRAVIVFCALPDGRGWPGGRPGVITKTWGDTPESVCNVSVTMDEGDAGHPQTTRLTSVRVYDGQERDPGVVPTAGPGGESIWAEWPVIAGKGPSAADTQYQETLAAWKKDSEAWGGRVGELEKRIGELGGQVFDLRSSLEEARSRLAAIPPSATTAAADVPGEPVTSGGKGKKN